LTVLLENAATGSEAGVALTVAISVAIGVVLEAPRDRVNVMVERIFFRQRYEAEAALRRFSRECAYIEKAGHLLDEAQEEIHRHPRLGASAFYETGITATCAFAGAASRRIRHRSTSMTALSFRCAPTASPSICATSRVRSPMKVSRFRWRCAACSAAPSCAARESRPIRATSAGCWLNWRSRLGPPSMPCERATRRRL